MGELALKVKNAQQLLNRVIIALLSKYTGGFNMNVSSIINIWLDYTLEYISIISNK